MPNISEDRKAFATRLAQALKRSPKKINSAADLALQFNLRHQAEPITQQAAQKWLSGSARPTLDKIETLSAWLKVSPQWLLYGRSDERPASSPKITKQKGRTALGTAPTAEQLQLLARIESLPEHQQEMIKEIVEQFVLGQEAWRE